MAALLSLAVALGGCGGKGETPTSAGEATVREAVEESSTEDEGAAKAAEEEAKKAAEEEAAQALEQEHAAVRAEAEANGLSVFTGTVHVMGGTDLCAFEDVDPNMNGNPDDVAMSTYAILVLDGTEHVVGMGADGPPREGDADHVGIGKHVAIFGDLGDDSASRWAEYDGMRVCVAGEPWFQTDVSLPFAPRMFDAELLYTE